jgi:hypothetical protein
METKEYELIPMDLMDSAYSSDPKKIIQEADEKSYFKRNDPREKNINIKMAFMFFFFGLVALFIGYTFSPGNMHTICQAISNTTIEEEPHLTIQIVNYKTNLKSHPTYKIATVCNNICDPINYKPFGCVFDKKTNKFIPENVSTTAHYAISLITCGIFMIMLGILSTIHLCVMKYAEVG